MPEKQHSTERKFPPVYEKAIPIVIIIIALVIIGFFLFSIAVATGWLTF